MADKRRNNRFKLIPSILKSSWVVKQAVGTTPVLLGNKLVTKYFRYALPTSCMKQAVGCESASKELIVLLGNKLVTKYFQCALPAANMAVKCILRQAL